MTSKRNKNHTSHLLKWILIDNPVSDALHTVDRIQKILYGSSIFVPIDGIKLLNLGQRAQDVACSRVKQVWWSMTEAISKSRGQQDKQKCPCQLPGRCDSPFPTKKLRYNIIECRVLQASIACTGGRVNVPYSFIIDRGRKLLLYF
jgi:hypothetical protein